jgi:hypothetical protein
MFLPLTAPKKMARCVNQTQRAVQPTHYPTQINPFVLCAPTKTFDEFSGKRFYLSYHAEVHLTGERQLLVSSGNT